MKSAITLLAVVVGRIRQLPLLIWIFAGVLAALVVFGQLAEEIWEGEGFAWDEPILRFIHSHATPSRDLFFLTFTFLGAARVMVPFTIGVFFYFFLQKRAVDALFFGLACWGAMILNLLAKVLFERARPALWVSPAPETTLSFPSGHAMTSMAVAAALVTLTWPTRWRWPVFIAGVLFVLVVGLSRLYLGVHFPSDVLAGWSASLAWVAGVYGIISAHRRGYFQAVHRRITRRTT
jgi:membrane-associated phospholipid phosphatase